MHYGNPSSDCPASERWRRYPRGVAFSVAVSGGFIGTVALTTVLYAANGAGWTNIRVIAAIASLFNGGTLPEVFSGVWWFGLVLHVLNGSVVLPAVYVYLIRPFLFGSPWVRGILFGFVLWIVFEAIIMPVTGRGFFGTRSEHRLLAVGEPLLVHLVYGLVLGAAAASGACERGGPVSDGSLPGQPGP